MATKKGTSKAPTYKLTYFDARGRAEVARLLFVASGTEFTDVRIQQSEWGKLKPTTPQGTVPVLEVDDGKKVFKISQSMAVNRYLAREFKLYGKGNIEMAVVDQLLDTLVDMFTPMIPMLFNSDKDEGAKQLADHKKNKVPRVLSIIEELIKVTGNKGFAVGSSLTIADLALLSVIENSGIQDCLTSDYPRLLENQETTKADKKIKVYLKDRKET